MPTILPTGGDEHLFVDGFGLCLRCGCARTVSRLSRCETPQRPDGESEYPHVRDYAHHPPDSGQEA